MQLLTGAVSCGGYVTGDVKVIKLMPAGPGRARRWYFASAILDEVSLELHVDGLEVEIERKPLEVLMHLLQHAGEVVTKDELLAAVWPGRILSDSVLTKAIGRVREVIGDDEQAIIKTVYGYGYRLAVPVHAEMQRVPERVHFNFAAGDRPPGRPLWSLMHRLGAGGHGEAWLGQHDKTREQRVFKFAIDEPSLTALKSEITLFRFLNDSLGERARIVPLIDWNLEQPPCFIESQYIVGGSLPDWAERCGGLAHIPLSTRLDVAAQIAEALASVHSVGVLHKDLKPSNILVDNSSKGTPMIRLADFGSGGVLDIQQLEALGITRMGFTRTLAAVNTTSGTLLYLAPELLAGQPPTVQADIYALGVMLYQLVIGEFRKAMSAGWEREIDDELLRADITQAAEGEPIRRLAHAAELAQRLRTLEERRVQREEDRKAQARAETLRLAAERMRARRTALIFAFAVMVTGFVVSTWLYVDARRARNEATAAAAASKAVADFLSKDMFAAVGTRPLRDLTVPELLKAASGTLAIKVQVMPEAAAQIHAALGSAFWTMEMIEDAEKHLDLALNYYDEPQTANAAAAASTAATLVLAKYMLGQLPTMLPLYESILERAQLELGAKHAAVLSLKSSLAQARLFLGDWRAAEIAFRSVVNDAVQVPGVDQMMLGSATSNWGASLLRLGEFEAAIVVMNGYIKQARVAAGTSQIPVVFGHLVRARALMETEQFSESESDLSRASELINAWAANDRSSWLQSVQLDVGQLRLRQGRVSEAITTLRNSIDALTGSSANNSELDGLAEWRLWLSRAYFEAGRLNEAEAEMRKAIASSAADFGPTHPMTQYARIGLADILRLKNQPAAARAVLDVIDQSALLALGADHPYTAELRRVQGLTALAQGQPARQALTAALHSFEIRYGAQHAFTRRARKELTAAVSTKPAGRGHIDES